jgi:hypothetical protein
MVLDNRQGSEYAIHHKEWYQSNEVTDIKPRQVAVKLIPEYNKPQIDCRTRECDEGINLSMIYCCNCSKDKNQDYANCPEENRKFKIFEIIFHYLVYEHAAIGNDQKEKPFLNRHVKNVFSNDIFRVKTPNTGSSKPNIPNPEYDGSKKNCRNDMY